MTTTQDTLMASEEINRCSPVWFRQMPPSATLRLIRLETALGLNEANDAVEALAFL